MTTEKTIALAIWTTVSRVMPLLFSTLSVCHSFRAKKQTSDFMAAVTICNGFRAPEEEIFSFVMEYYSAIKNNKILLNFTYGVSQKTSAKSSSK